MKVAQVVKTDAGEELRQVVEQYVELHPEGDRLVGVCPFHADTKPSFSVYEDGHFHCFGCGAHGDAGQFVRRIEEVGLPVSAAEQAELHEPDPVIEAAAEYYRHMSSPEGVQQYWESRGIELGLAIAGRADGGLGAYLRERGVSEEQLLASGLIGEDGGEDHFFNCTVFPVLKGGRVVDLVARGDPDGGGLRWIRRKGVPVNYMYNEDALGPDAEVVVCEGITDALTLIQRGIPAVGLPSAYLKDPALIKRLSVCRSVLICLDRDETGRKAAIDLAGALGSQAKFIALPEFEVKGAPGKDVNDYFMSGGSKADFQGLMQDAAESGGEFLLRQLPPKTKGEERVVFVEKEVLPALKGEGRSRAYLMAVLEGHGFGTRAVDSFLKSYGGLPEPRSGGGVVKPLVEVQAVELEPPDPEDEEAAQEFLRSPNLVERLASDLDDIGIVGERSNKQLMYLAFTSRKTDRPIGLEVRGPSGVGKSYLVSKVVSLMPEEDVVEFTRITTHFPEYLEEDGLVNKVLVIAETAGAEDAAYGVRMLGDDTSPGITLGTVEEELETHKKVARRLHVRGPVAVCVTTVKLERDVQDESRAFQVYLDDSSEHRRQVHEHVKRAETPSGRSVKEAEGKVVRMHRAAQRLLRPLPVTIPFSYLIDFPVGKTRSTRDLKRLLSVGRASALLHQLQRETILIDGREHLVATIQDYEVALNVAASVLRDDLSELSPPARVVYHRVCRKGFGQGEGVGLHCWRLDNRKGVLHPWEEVPDGSEKPYRVGSRRWHCTRRES